VLVPDAVPVWRFGTGDYTQPRPITLLEMATGEVIRTFKGHQKMIYSVVFAPDGRTFATASLDGTALIWDATGRLEGGHIPLLEQPPEDFEHCWEALRSADAARGHRAVWQLVAAGDGAVERIQRRLKPAAPVESETLAKWLARLDSKSFAERGQAEQRLRELDAARPVLRKVLARGELSLEARRRLEGVLEWMVDPAAGPERLRAWRALQVLEQIGTPRARALLEALAAGVQESHLTQQARQALRRLAVPRAALP
jgi:hypothetical protein